MTSLLPEASSLGLRDQLARTEKASTVAEMLSFGSSTKSRQHSLFSANNPPGPHPPHSPEDQLIHIDRDVSQLEAQLCSIRESCTQRADGYYMRPVEVDQLIESLKGIRQQVLELKESHFGTSTSAVIERRKNVLAASSAAAAADLDEAAGGHDSRQLNGEEGSDDSNSRACSPPIPLNASEAPAAAVAAAAGPALPPVPLVDQMQLGHQLLLPPFLVGSGFGSLDLMSAFAGAGYGVDMLKMLQQQVRETPKQQPPPPPPPPPPRPKADPVVMAAAPPGASVKRASQDRERLQQLQQQQQRALSPQLPPLDTSQIASEVRGLLSRHNIGQRLFAKQVLSLSQGTVSELLSKPKPWDKLTEKGRESYRKMSIWAASESSVLSLKAMAPIKRGLPAELDPESLPLRLEDKATSRLSAAAAGAAKFNRHPQLLPPAAAASAHFDSDASRSSSQSEELGGKLVMDAPLTDRQQHQHRPLLLPSVADGEGAGGGSTRDIVRGIYRDQLRKAREQASTDGDEDTVARLDMEMRSLEAETEDQDSVDEEDEDADGSVNIDLHRLHQQGSSQIRLQYPHLLPPLSLGGDQPPPAGASSGGSGGMSSLKLSKMRLSPITKKQVEKYWELNTDELVREVKELLNQYSISQRLFGEQVLGLSQGSVSDLLARPKPWSMLTQKGREPFIRMRIFADDPTAVARLVPTNPPLMRQSQSALQLHRQSPPPPQPPPQQQLLDHMGSSMVSTICANSASYLPDTTIAQMAKSLSFDIDTAHVCQSVLEVMGHNHLSYQQLGSTVLGLSEARTAELLHSPVPWHELSVKEREPYLRLNLWLANTDSPIRLHQSQGATESRGIKRSHSAAVSTAQANDVSDAASSGESPGAVSSGKKARYMFTDAQKEILQEVFSGEPYPSYNTVERLAGEFHLPVKTVSNWFHNHRMRNKAAAAAAAVAAATASAIAVSAVAVPDSGRESPISAGLDLRTSASTPITKTAAAALPSDEAPVDFSPQLQATASSRRKASKPMRLLATSQDGAAPSVSGAN